VTFNINHREARKFQVAQRSSENTTTLIKIFKLVVLIYAASFWHAEERAHTLFFTWWIKNGKACTRNCYLWSTGCYLFLLTFISKA